MSGAVVDFSLGIADLPAFGLRLSPSTTVDHDREGMQISFARSIKHHVRCFLRRQGEE